MMSREEELNHLPAKGYDAIKALRDKFGGSSQRMAEKLTREFCTQLNNEEVKETLTEGFDPIA